ncbi:hypothetical protein [Candidatus Manganitrophus noduliformans]|uniref:Uncharacterized protein n=1 Tax=Candidatus Manganitrophus noduliformans TaxID=2606439 RepID=A0A7X6DT88_9BACT|nr:hypothetical protein [Candidatus Manganitrophus noduliformans]NKE72976.1 hypothetical protein [Candidatus Manganitrophus noduliformans]
MNLELQIGEIEARAPHYRSLSLECTIYNRGGKEIALLEAWITVKTSGDSTLVDGFHYQQYNAPAYRATIKAGEKGNGRILIPLTPDILYSLEQERSGKDLQFMIYSRVLIAPIESVELNTGEPVYILGAPQETRFSAGGSFPIAHKIPQSEWIKLLSSMKWLAIELFELPMETFSSDPDLQRAIELLREAQSRFFRGDWPGTLQNCRQAFEAAAGDVGQSDSKKDNFQKLSNRLGGGRKSEKLNSLISSVSGFTHLGRHEDFPKIDITREDALMALRCTLSIFSLLGGRIV